MSRKIYLGGTTIRIATKGNCSNYISLTDLESKLNSKLKSKNLLNDWLRSERERFGLMVVEWLGKPGGEIEVFNQIIAKFSNKGQIVSPKSWIAGSGTNEMFIKNGKQGGVYASLSVAEQFLKYLKLQDLLITLREGYEVLISCIVAASLNKIMDDFAAVTSNGRTKNSNVESSFLDIDGYESLGIG